MDHLVEIRDIRVGKLGAIPARHTASKAPRVGERRRRTLAAPPLDLEALEIRERGARHRRCDGLGIDVGAEELEDLGEDLLREASSSS